MKASRARRNRTGGNAGDERAVGERSVGERSGDERAVGERSRTNPTLLVADREVRQGLASRAFRISVVVTVISVAALGLLPRLVGSGDSGPPRYDVAIPSDAPPDLRPGLEAAAPAVGARVDVKVVASRADAERQVRAGDVDAALFGDDMLVDGEPPTRLRALVEQGSAAALQAERARQAGLTDAQVNALSAPVAPLTVQSVASHETNSDEFVVATIALVALFMAVTFYGGAVMNGVLQEKSSRVVEVILAAVSPRQLLSGKLLGIGLLGLAQVVLLAIVAFVTTRIAGTASLPSSTAPTIALAVLWFALGYALYSSLFAMAGSLVSRQEDGQSAATPVSLLTTGSYLLAFVVVLPNPGGVFARILTFVPLTAPTTVLARSALGRIAAWEVAVSAVVTAISVVGVVALAARVYSGAALHMGGRLPWRAAFRAGGDDVGSATTTEAQPG
jgi:ABC-2 type transport system permease protein